MLLLTGACASAPPPPPPPAPVPFRYATAGTLRYELTDTTRFDAQMARTEIAARALVDYRLANDPAGAQVSAQVVDLDGRFSNTATGGSVPADESGARGAFTFRLSPKGTIHDFARPPMGQEFQQVTRSGELLRAPFLRLPDEPLVRGASWVDTVTSTETNEGVTTTTLAVVTSTWTRDTVVAGRPLPLIESSSRNSVELRGAVQGAAIEQNLEGTTSAVAIWDPERGAVLWRRSSGSLSGSMTLPQVGTLPVRVDLVSSARLESGG